MERSGKPMETIPGKTLSSKVSTSPTNSNWNDFVGMAFPQPCLDADEPSLYTYIIYILYILYYIYYIYIIYILYILYILYIIYDILYIYTYVSIDAGIAMFWAQLLLRTLFSDLRRALLPSCPNHGCHPASRRRCGEHRCRPEAQRPPREMAASQNGHVRC